MMTEEKTKIRKSFNYLIRAVIILVTYGFIYRQVFVEKRLQEIPGLYAKFTEQEHVILQLCLILLLMLVNWGIESVKWKILISKIEEISFFRAFKAVMTGVSVSLFTPNRTGDYLGRVFILKKANHVEGVLLTLVGSFAQIVITFSAGLICFLYFVDSYLRVPYHIPGYLVNSLVVFVPVLVFFILLLYFKIGLLTDFISRNLPGRWERFVKYLHVLALFKSKELLTILLLSLFRYLIFSAQFMILLRIFGADLPVSQGLILIPVIYLVMALVPTITLTELGIRGSVSIFIIGLYFQRSGGGGPETDLAILSAASVLWLVNLVIPAILGTFFVFSLKFFRK